MHGVRSKKIRHMLDTYEHNITAQSLFDMVCSKQQAVTTSAGSCNNSADNLPPNTAADAAAAAAAADNLSCFKSSLSSTSTDVTSLHSSVTESLSVSTASVSTASVSTVSVPTASVPTASVSTVSVCTVPASEASQCLVTASSSDCLLCEAVCSCQNDVSLPSSLLVNSSSSVCCETVGAEHSASSTRTVCTACVSSVSAVSSSCISLDPTNSSGAQASGVTAQASGVTAQASGVTAHASDVTAQMLGVTAQTSGVSAQASGVTAQMLGVTAQTSGVTAPASAVTIQTSGVITQTSGVTTQTSGVTAQASGVTTQTSGVITQTSGVTTQTSGVTAQKHDAMQLISSTVDAVSYSSTAESGAEPDNQSSDKDACNLNEHVFCYVKSVCSQDEAVDSRQTSSQTEPPVHLAADKSVDCLLPTCPGPVQADLMSDEKYVNITLCLNTDCENEVHNSVHNVDKDKTAKLSSASVDEQLCEITADKLQSNVTVQPVAQSAERDSFSVNEAEVGNNLERQCGDAPAAAELMYWRRTDSNKRCNEAEVHCGVADSVAEPYIPRVEPKPQRTRPHGCEKKHISSLAESILVGKEWVTERQHGWNSAFENSKSDEECSFSNDDESSTEQHCVSHEFKSSSTQTEPCDFITLTNVTHDDKLIDMKNYVAVVLASPREISLHVTDSQLTPSISCRLLLHKSCSTADETENVESSLQLDFLKSCFPNISSEDLQKLLTDCGDDVVVAADLLLELGYTYNEPPQVDVTDITSSSTSCTDSASCSPDRSVDVEKNSPTTKVTRNRKNTSAPYRLCRDSLIHKGIVLESRKMWPQFQVQVPVYIPSSSLCFIPLLLFIAFCSLFLKIHRIILLCQSLN